MRYEVNRSAHRQGIGEIQRILQRAYRERRVLETQDAISVAALEKCEFAFALRRPELAKASPCAGQCAVKKDQVWPFISRLGRAGTAAPAGTGPFRARSDNSPNPGRRSPFRFSTVAASTSAVRACSVHAKNLERLEYPPDRASVGAPTGAIVRFVGTCRSTEPASRAAAPPKRARYSSPRSQTRVPSANSISSTSSVATSTLCSGAIPRLAGRNSALTLISTSGFSPAGVARLSADSCTASARGPRSVKGDATPGFWVRTGARRRARFDGETLRLRDFGTGSPGLVKPAFLVQ